MFFSSTTPILSSNNPSSPCLLWRLIIHDRHTRYRKSINLNWRNSLPDHGIHIHRTTNSKDSLGRTREWDVVVQRKPHNMLLVKRAILRKLTGHHHNVAVLLPPETLSLYHTVKWRRCASRRKNCILSPSTVKEVVNEKR